MYFLQEDSSAAIKFIMIWLLNLILLIHEESSWFHTSLYLFSSAKETCPDHQICSIFFKKTQVQLSSWSIWLSNFILLMNEVPGCILHYISLLHLKKTVQVIKFECIFFKKTPVLLSSSSILLSNFILLINK